MRTSTTGERDRVEGTNKMEVSSGFVSSGAFSSAEEGPRGLPLVKRPIISWKSGYWVWAKYRGGDAKFKLLRTGRGESVGYDGMNAAPHE